MDYLEIVMRVTKPTECLHNLMIQRYGCLLPSGLDIVAKSLNSVAIGSSFNKVDYVRLVCIDHCMNGQKC